MEKQMSKLVNRDKVFDEKFKLLRRDLNLQESAYIKSWIRYKMHVVGHDEDNAEESQEGQRIYNERYNKKEN